MGLSLADYSMDSYFYAQRVCHVERIAQFPQSSSQPSDYSSLFAAAHEYDFAPLRGSFQYAPWATGLSIATLPPSARTLVGMANLELCSKTVKARERG